MDNNFYGDFNRQMLLLAHAAIKHEDAELMKTLGLDRVNETLKSSLRDITVSQLQQAVSFRGLLAEVRYNDTALRNFVAMSSNKQAEDDLVKESIIAGIRQPQLQQLKGIGRRDYDKLRAKLGVPERPRGPIERLDDEQEALVYRAWRSSTSVRDKLERLIDVHRKTGVPLDQIHLAISDVDTAEG
jgi:hypothetical protein